MTYLSETAKQAFQEAVLQSVMIIDSSGGKIGKDGIDLDIDPRRLEGLGTTKFMVFGAYAGHTLQGSNADEYLFGTNHDDVIAGYQMTANGGVAFAPENSGNDELRGFAGDDPLPRRCWQ